MHIGCAQGYSDSYTFMGKEERDTFRVGVNAFVLKHGKLLLGERLNDNWQGGGGWGLPGGHLEFGEYMKDAVARELKEETGLHAKDFKFAVLCNDNRDNQVHYIQIGFLAKGVEEEEPEIREPDRCAQWKWFSFEELPEHIFIGHRKLIKAFIEKMSFIE